MKRWLLLLATLLPVWHGACDAHSTGISYVGVTETSSDHGLLNVEVSLSLRDLDAVVNLDPNDNGQITWGEVRHARDDIERYIIQKLRVADTTPCTLQPQNLLVDSLPEGAYAIAQLTALCPHAGGAHSAVQVHSDLLFEVDPAQRTLLTSGAAGTQILTTDARDWRGSLTQPTRWQSLQQFLTEGIWHIWTGVDHLAFLMTLLLPAALAPYAASWRTRMTSIVKIVTAFTAAHSITLGLATLGYVRLPSRPVEATIALSITVAGLANLHPRTRHLGVFTAFTFGLIHGFGFASALQAAGTSTLDHSLALCGFNLGVEAGQLVIVALTLPVLTLLRQYEHGRRHALPVLSIATATLGAIWFCQRVFAG